MTDSDAESSVVLDNINQTGFETVFGITPTPLPDLNHAERAMSRQSNAVGARRSYRRPFYASPEFMHSSLTGRSSGSVMALDFAAAPRISKLYRRC